MRRSTLGTTCLSPIAPAARFQSWAREQRGVGALMLVMGAALVILVIAAALAGQSRQDLRMASAERDASQVQSQVAGVFRYAAAKAADSTWPGLPGAPGAAAVDGHTPCNPATPTVAGQAYPLYCRDFLPRRQVQMTTADGRVVDQIPVRVRWQAASDSVPEDTFGWILTSRASESGAPVAVLGVFYYHRPCTLELNYVVAGPCKRGR